MSILNRTDLQADRSRPLYVKFDSAKRTGKDSGVTLFGTVAKFGDGSTFKFEGDRITLYDSHFGPPGKECALTNPCMVYKDGEYWSVREVEGKEIAYESPKLAPKPDPKPAWGGGGGGQSNLTKAQQDALYREAWKWTVDFLGEDGQEPFCDLADNAFTSVVATRFIGYCRASDAGESPAGDKVEPADDDIPF